MEIRVQVRDVYGRPTVYPACARSVIFARIAGTKTLSDRVLSDIEALGFTVTVETPHVCRTMSGAIRRVA